MHHRKTSHRKSAKKTNKQKSQNKTYMCVRHSSRHREKEGKTETQKWRKGTTDVAGPGAIQVIMVQTAPMAMLY